MGQTELETSKIQNNKDVGLSCLESYSRVLEGRASSIFQRIQDVLDTNIKISRKRGIVIPNLMPRPNTYSIFPVISPSAVVGDDKDVGAFEKNEEMGSIER